MPSTTISKSTLLSLPAELRTQILEYVFTSNLAHNGLISHSTPGGLCLDDEYTAQTHLSPLLVCRQLYLDGHHLAFTKTHFLMTNLFSSVPERSARLLRPKTIKAIRHLTFVADARHFRALSTWGPYPFSMPSLHLETLTIALYRSTFCHYLFDFTAGIVRLLRELRNVRRVVVVRNGALVKGGLRAWFNRLVGLVLKVDHRERYMGEGGMPRCEGVWWGWGFDEVEQRFWLEAREPKPLLDEETYLRGMLPLMDELRVSVESEEWNPDPRSRRHYY
ncbi:hypothetical protein M409DRAFT_26673 [Zasmidium cellare ATCC 36951]|uniref:Uncharacterized protein n=1 Tax=Zasmidium cellare ATCC 36951 TaxID=1080233 RepID=A0A6A6C9A7_ZASCE|nr:uncharacterized protein M409DRAFT_26673 [Zasmidium cellare ATCC 36951]KAF2162818.1 hypothetical protein M409DRAFT_26673 [Zasmidium cellare ATCC 36951]